MMKKNIYLFCLIFLLFPEIVLGSGKNFLTGAETDSEEGAVYDTRSGLGEGSLCSKSGSGVTSNISVTEIYGKCTAAGHTRIGTTDKCCPIGYSLENGTCKKTDGEYEECSESKKGCPDGCNLYPDGKCKKWIDKTLTETPSTYLYGYYVKINVTGNSNCGSAKITCKGNKEGAVTVNITKAYEPWQQKSCPPRGCWFRNRPLTEKNLAYRSGSIAVNNAKNVDGLYTSTSYSTRGCGDYQETPQPGYEPEDISGCWRRKISDPDYNTIYGETDYYEYKWSHVGYCGGKRCNTTLGGTGWELYKLAGQDGMTEDLCVRKKSAICQPTTPAELNKQKQANYCNAKNVNVPLDEHTKCETNGNKFYQIDCLENVSADYNPVNFEKVLVNGNYIDEKIAVVQPGTGFRYNVNINHVRTCQGYFKADVFNPIFENIVEILRRADIYEDKKEYAWYSAILDAINLIAQTYEDQYTNIVESKKYLFNYNGTISFDYKWKESAQSKQTEFVLNNEEEKVYLNEKNPIFKETYIVQTGVPNFVNHKLVSGITTKKLYKFEYTLHQESLLEPKRIYIDSKTGNEVESGIDAGKKVFTEIKTDDTKEDNYKVTTQISVYKKSSPTKAIITITNEKCELKVISDKVSYRIIEPTNPFVNSAREIPKNWNGSIGDFTKVINPSIGSTLIK